MKHPIIMVGIQRSGSNLLRLMLNQLSCVAAPHPPHIMERISPLLPTYGNLENSDTFALLVDDVCRLIELNPVPWEGVTLDRNQIQKRCRENSLVAIFVAVYDILAETWGRKTWCCKSLANIYYLKEINAYLDNAKYIWLYRDGRDVACSFSKAVVGEKHFYHLAHEWKKAQCLALRMRSQLSRNRFFSLSYESLISDPESTLQSLCNFLEVDYTPEMLDFYESKEAVITASSSSLWSNVKDPIKQDNTKKFLHYSYPEEVRIFELIAGDILSILDYDRVYTKEGETLSFSSAEIAEFDRINQERKKQIAQNMDLEDREKRQKQSTLLESIKLRNLKNYE